MSLVFQFEDIKEVRNQRVKIELHIADPAACPRITNMFRRISANLMDLQRTHEGRPTLAELNATHGESSDTSWRLRQLRANPIQLIRSPTTL